jgi:hypothetical protein
MEDSEVKKERRKSVTKDEMEELLVKQLDHMQYRMYKSNRVIDEGLNQRVIDRLDELETIIRQLASKDGIDR